MPVFGSTNILDKASKLFAESCQDFIFIFDRFCTGISNTSLA